VAILCSIVVIRWFQINPGIILNTRYGFFSGLGRLAGLIGLVLYSFNLFLSTRLRFLENLFGGLNRVYIAHHIIGGVALVALLIHPMSLALKFVPEQLYLAAQFLLPVLAQPIDWPIIYGEVAFLGMVLLLIITFYVKLPYELWRFTHKFLGLAFFFAGLHILVIPSDISRDMFLRTYILTMAAIGLTSFIYRTLLGKILIRREPYVVSKVERITEGVTRIELVPERKIINYKPGQFVFIRFFQKGLSEEIHPFSISSAPTQDIRLADDNTLSITVKSLGDFTSRLSQLTPGTQAEIEGAFGKFTYTNFNSPKQIWIAGGIGVTPFLSMARSHANQFNTDKREIHMFYSVRDESELIDQQELFRLSGNELTNFHYYPYAGNIEKRLITADYINAKVGGFQDADLFICGPPPMMKELKHQLIDFGVAKSKIHTEEFSIN
jgi:predicted ferric reductase